MRRLAAAGLCHAVLYSAAGALDLEELLGGVYRREADAAVDARTVCASCWRCWRQSVYTFLVTNGSTPNLAFVIQSCNPSNILSK